MDKKFYIPPMEKTHDLSDAGGMKRILVLEDDTEFTQLLVELLGPQQYRVTAVTSGVDGLKEIMANDFDIVLCDMMMPNLPGDMFYLAVQRTKPNLCKRFIFMTGHKGNPRIDNFIRSVGGLMLWKPFELYQLLDAIKVVERKAQEA